MPKSAEQLRRELQEVKEAAVLEAERKNIRLQEEELERKKAESAVSFVLKPTDNEVKAADLVQEYKKQFDKEPRNDGVLDFASEEEALSFFSKVAAENKTFFATRVQGTQELDEHVFSCGDSKLYKGSYAEIKQQLEDAAKANPSNKVTAAGLEKFCSLIPKATSDLTSNMRVHAQAQRDAVEKAQPTDAPEDTSENQLKPSGR